MSAKRVAAIILLLALCGCGPQAPDKSLILWDQPSPQIAAQAHAREIGGVALLVLPTGSMEPYLTGGDFIVADLKFQFDGIESGDLLIYQAGWLPPTSPVVCHMAAAKSGDEWIMDGIHNEHYEAGSLRMKREHYRGKVVQVYTKRPKQ